MKQSHKPSSWKEHLEEDATSFLSRYEHYRRAQSRKDEAWKNFCHEVKIPLWRRISRSTWMRCAAAILLPLLMVGFYFAYTGRTATEIRTLAQVKPGSSQAVLVLSGGNELALDSASDASLAVGNGAVASVGGNRISYQDASDAESDGGNTYNTLLTRRGGEYRIVLADGTRVHLNADSKLKFPVAFNGTERNVYLEGEAYFEVAHNEEKPFFVHVQGMKIRQYGTAFNVHAYPHEDVEVVLVKGSIGVTAGTSRHMLKPGQLATLKEAGRQLSVEHVDVSSYVAWNEGRFYFVNEKLEDIMKSLSRWYDIDIHFDTDEIRALHFTGSLDRYDTIDPIMQAIAGTVNVKARMKGRTLHLSR